MLSCPLGLQHDTPSHRRDPYYPLHSKKLATKIQSTQLQYYKTEGTPHTHREQPRAKPGLQAGLSELASRHGGTKRDGRGSLSHPQHIQSPDQPARPDNEWGLLFTAHPQTTPRECHGMTSLMTTHRSYDLATSAKRSDTHLPCKSPQIPTLP